MTLLARIRSTGPFKRGFAYTLVLDVGSRGVSAISLIILIRRLPTPAFAFVVLFLAVGQFAGSSATSGIRMLYLRNEAERVSRGSVQPSGFASCALTQTVALGMVGAIGFAVAAAADIGTSTERVVMGLGGSLFAFGMATTELARARGEAHLRFFQAGLIAVTRSLLLLLVTLSVFVGVVSGETIAVASAGAIAVLGLAAAVVIARREAVPARLRLRDWVIGSEAGWLTVYYVGSAGYATVDVFLIAALLGTADVAAYGAAQRYQAIVLGALPSLIAVFRVRTSQGDLVDSETRQRAMLTTWLRRFALPALVSMAMIAAFAPFVIPLVNGNRYALSVPLFELLMVGAIATYLVTPAPSLLMAQRRFRLLAYLVAGAVVANALGDTVMALAFGIIELVAFAVVVDLILSFAMVRCALRRPLTPARTRTAANSQHFDAEGTDRGPALSP